MNAACSRAYDEGYAAAVEGRDEDANPYPVEDDEHLSWNDGYAAFSDEDVLVQHYSQDRWHLQTAPLTLRRQQ